MKNNIIKSLLILHLVVIYTGSRLVNISSLPLRTQGIAALYLAAVGGNGYAFFALGDLSEGVVKCYILDQNSEVLEEDYGGGDGTFDFRASIFMQLLIWTRSPEVASRTAARHCFIRHPGAKSVKVCIGTFRVPTVREFEAGKKYEFSETSHRTYLNE